VTSNARDFCLLSKQYLIVTLFSVCDRVNNYILLLYYFSVMRVIGKVSLQILINSRCLWSFNKRDVRETEVYSSNHSHWTSISKSLISVLMVF